MIEYFPVLCSRNMDKLKNIEKEIFININRVGGARKLLHFKLLEHFNQRWHLQTI